MVSIMTQEDISWHLTLCREIVESLKSGLSELGRGLFLFLASIGLLAVGWFLVVPFVTHSFLPQFGIHPEVDDLDREGTIYIPSLELAADWGLESVYVRSHDEGIRAEGDPFHPADDPWMTLWSIEEAVDASEFETTKSTAHGGLIHIEGSSDGSNGDVILDGILELEDRNFRFQCGARAATDENPSQWCLPYLASLRGATTPDDDLPICGDWRLDADLERTKSTPLPQSGKCQVTSR